MAHLGSYKKGKKSTKKGHKLTSAKAKKILSDGTVRGKKISKKAKTVIKFNPTRMHRPEDIKKFGFYIIEME